MPRTTRKGVRQPAAESAPAPAEDNTVAAAPAEGETAPPDAVETAPAETTRPPEDGFEREGFAAIVARRKVRAAAEAVDGDPDDEANRAAAQAAAEAAETPAAPVAEPEPDPAPPAADGEDPPAAAADPEPEPAPAQTAPATAPLATIEEGPKFQIKVNGIPRTVGLEEFTALAQKGLGADEKFREAARLRDEAEQLRRNPGASAPASGAEPSPGSPPSPKSTDAPSIDLDAAVEAIQFGDKDKAKEALQGLITTAVAEASKGRSTATPEDIEARAVATMRSQMQFDRDLNTFGEKYPDLVKDQYLVNITAQHVNAIRATQLTELGYTTQQLKSATPAQLLATIRTEQANGRAPSDAAVFDEAGKRVTDWLDSKRPKPAAGDPPTPPAPKPAAESSVSPTRTEIKAAAPQPPRPAIAPRNPTPPPPVPKTRGQVVNEFRKSRGQPT